MRSKLHLLSPHIFKSKRYRFFLLFSYMSSHCTKRDWEARLNRQTWPTMAEMNTFLKNRCHFLESMDFGKTDNRNQKVTKTSMQISATPNQNCFLCQKSHRLFQCNDFLKLAIPERLNKVKELKLCTNCFASTHRVSDCKGRVCKYCQKKHKNKNTSTFIKP
jgi:hypothetical protein